MRLSEAGSQDLKAVVALWELAGLTRPWNDPIHDFRLALKNPTSSILIATEGSKIVGSVMTGFDGHRGWVYYLATHPDRRGAGIARQLMQAVETRLRIHGSPKIQLMVRSDNQKARGFYEALGYEVQDVITIGLRLD